MIPDPIHKLEVCVTFSDGNQIVFIRKELNFLSVLKRGNDEE